MAGTPPLEEDWSSYRKLVIDTLRRLDERTLGFHESLNELHTRVSLLEHASNEEEVTRIDNELIALRVDFFRFKTSIEAQDQAKINVKKNNHMWIGGIWAVIAVVASALLDGWAGKLFGG